MKNRILLSTIIVNHNTKGYLTRCLESLRRETELKDHEIIVVDNASGDGSAQMIKKQFSEVKLIQNKQNLGFAKANNQAFQQAQGGYCLLLNSDTEVKSGALERLVEFAKSYPEAGVTGARLLNSDGSPQASCYHFPTIWRAIGEYWFGQKGIYEKYVPTESNSVSVEAVTGAAMLIPRRTIKKVGFLDERYFMYFEDLDYCRRIKRVGLKVYYLPTAEIVHHHGASGQAIPTQTRQWLIKSSKIYNGRFKYYSVTFIIWLSQKWKKILRKI